MELIQHLIDHWSQILAAGLAAFGAFTAFLAALYGFFLVIPGEQPDKTLKQFLDFTTKISRKAPPLIVVLAAATLLMACSTDIDRTGQACERRVAASEVAITHGYESTGKLFVAGVIDKDDAQKALKAIDTANALTDRALPLCALDEPQALDFLLQAGNLMIDVQHIFTDKE